MSKWGMFNMESYSVDKNLAQFIIYSFIQIFKVTNALYLGQSIGKLLARKYTYII